MKVLLSTKELLLLFDCIAATYIQLTESDLDSTTGTKANDRRKFRIFILESIVQNIHFGLNFKIAIVFDVKQIDIAQMYLGHGEYWFDDDVIRGTIDDIKQLENKITSLLENIG